MRFSCRFSSICRIVHCCVLKLLSDSGQTIPFRDRGKSSAYRYDENGNSCVTKNDSFDRIERSAQYPINININLKKTLYSLFCDIPTLQLLTWYKKVLFIKFHIM